MFSLYLGSDGSDGKIILGGYDEAELEERIRRIGNSGSNQSGVDKKYGLHWMKTNSEFYWQVNLYCASIGDTVISNSQDSMMFNTGASLNYIPKE